MLHALPYITITLLCFSVLMYQSALQTSKKLIKAMKERLERQESTYKDRVEQNAKLISQLGSKEADYETLQGELEEVKIELNALKSKEEKRMALKRASYERVKAKSNA